MPQAGTRFAYLPIEKPLTFGSIRYLPGSIKKNDEAWAKFFERRQLKFTIAPSHALFCCIRANSRKR